MLLLKGINKGSITSNWIYLSIKFFLGHFTLGVEGGIKEKLNANFKFRYKVNVLEHVFHVERCS